jgi:hypothetical protein
MRLLKGISFEECCLVTVPNSDQSVAFVAANWLEPTQAAYAVIAATFGDTV